MKFMLRIALQLLAIFIFLLICIEAIVIGVAWLIWPQLISSGNSSGHYEIFVTVLCLLLFLVTLLLIGWYLGKPLYHMVVWIRRLANGRYDPPPAWDNLRAGESGRLKFPYAIYKELFEHLRLLTRTLHLQDKTLREVEQTKREWIQGISHDLKTPLTYIAGYSAMLLHPEYRWSDTEQKQFLSVISQKAAHLQELVQDLNETVQGEIPLKAEKTDIVELVRRTVADVGSAPWAAEYLFSMDSDPDCIPVFCDTKLVTRAVRNLLVNAVVHNPAGTRITVWTSLYDDGTVEIRIKDNGVGFNETPTHRDDALHAFEPAGLGLSIARRFIEGHGGSLHVLSKPGEGSSITIRLRAEES
ncbi:sensor histidine kinase [Paenibacillus cineris]|uniref:histidine kinase n=1 Tax=Paenibacillus cineris TaxID=237530 RepID=A0ABQ4L7G1_9BACL|nr:HAMP domain-containing sensor histidine kinase [Paenibacillus cineris]GIO52522.1 hypothetical protein J21TS7_08400 [Paenibacillus cineris]